MKPEYDVLIVGAGGSGLAAAVSAAELGCSVLVLEKCPEAGGTTGIAVGSFTGNLTALQRVAGIADSTTDHEEDAGRFAPAEIESRNNAALRRFFLGHTADTLDWLMGMGLVFHGPNPEPPNRVPRMHNVVPNAKAYIATLSTRLAGLGGELRCGVTANDLIRDDVGRVVGLRTDLGETVHARRGVVLAGGDYANAHDLIARHKGDRFGRIDGINSFATGEGHRLAEAAGAKMLNMDVTYGPELRFVPPRRGDFFSRLLPGSGLLSRLLGFAMPCVPQFVTNAYVKRLLVTWQHPENALFDDGAILLNREGERFCNETVWPDREIAIASQSGKEAFLLLDQRLCERYSRWPHFISTAPKIAYAYVDDYLRLRKDIAFAGDSPAEICQAAGMSGDPGGAIFAFNEYVEGRRPDPHGRKGDQHALVGTRWVLFGPAKACFTTTEGGAAIDEDLRVLDGDGVPIPGLYAVGQNGLGGQILWGHGLHIAWALTSGRLVGRVLGALGQAGESGVSSHDERGR